MLLKLALESLKDRKSSVVLAVIAMTISIFVLLAVEHVRSQTKKNFYSTVSGVDLIVGARTGQINLLLYSVFRLGQPTNNIRWQSFQQITQDDRVNWAIPISLGDSHKGYPVLGTDNRYFEHFKYAQQQALKLVKGHQFTSVFDVVIGANVATKLGYQLGDKITLSHGMSSTSFSQHDDLPFTVTGILAPTGTAVDQTLHVQLTALEAIHKGWHGGVKMANVKLTQTQLNGLKVNNITAFMLGLNSKMSTFQVQRAVNDFAQEPLTAILPGVALSQLWQMMRGLERALVMVTALVFIAASFGVSAMLLASIRERQKEIQLLRVIGAPAIKIILLILIEATVITLISIGLALFVLFICLNLLQSYLMVEFALHVHSNLITANNLYLLLGVLLTALFIAFIPAISGYQQTKKAW
ncbi:ABC transporter permease [Gayadomonas joobiniege]|uniref:ABC transporter permease n=1 Tax=Gayadomonas joobiniege TaxID=1234606 RepID=UPI00035D373D|nr:FtsX-like permease family protein [Gayadomonas joobiniege]